MDNTAIAARQNHQPEGQRGVALLLVLWSMVLMTVMAGGFVYVMRTETSVVTNLVGKTRARAAAEAGLHYAAMDLTRSPAQRRFLFDGSLHEWRFADYPVRFSIQDQAGKIDLNRSPRALLAGLLASVGVEEERRNALLDAIEDWRDPDQLRHPLGAEDEDYAEAGLAHGAKDAPFESVSELQQVMGMSPELYRRLAGALTVDSKTGKISPVVAPKDVLMAVPGLDPETIERYLEQRREAAAQDMPPPPPPNLGGYGSNRSGGTYRVHVEARSPRGAVAVIEANIIARPRGDPPIISQMWSEDPVGGSSFGSAEGERSAPDATNSTEAGAIGG